MLIMFTTCNIRSNLTPPHLAYAHVLTNQFELVQLYPAPAAGVTPAEQRLQSPGHLCLWSAYLSESGASTEFTFLVHHGSLAQTANLWGLTLLAYHTRVRGHLFRDDLNLWPPPVSSPALCVITQVAAWAS